MLTRYRIRCLRRAAVPRAASQPGLAVHGTGGRFNAFSGDNEHGRMIVIVGWAAVGC
jgi:hypothetical protein